MQLNTQTNHNEKNTDIYLFFAMLALLVIPTYFYGPRVLITAAVALATAIICEILFNFLFSYKRVKHDYMFLTTAMACALIMPASVAYYVVVIAVSLGLFLGKYVFGAAGKNIFNPTAVGVSIAALSFPNEVLIYPQAGTKLPLDLIISDSVVAATSPATTLNVGGTPTINMFDLLLGDYVGSTGATGILVLAAVMLFLLVTKAISFFTVFPFLATAAVYATLFPRLNTGAIDSMIFEAASGILIFGLIFIICDKTTSPKTNVGKIIYGIFVALLTMIYRSLGALDIEIAFVALAANAISAQFDVWAMSLFGTPAPKAPKEAIPVKSAILDDESLEEVLQDD